MNDHDGEFDPAEAMGEVIDAAQMYLSECDPSNLAIIPERCMPYPIISAEDVELYAHKLRKECVARRASGAESPGELEAMREFFARAARVIYLLRIKPPWSVPREHLSTILWRQTRRTFSRPS